MMLSKVAVYHGEYLTRVTQIGIVYTYWRRHGIRRHGIVCTYWRPTNSTFLVSRVLTYQKVCPTCVRIVYVLSNGPGDRSYISMVARLCGSCKN